MAITPSSYYLMQWYIPSTLPATSERGWHLWLWGAGGRGWSATALSGLCLFASVSPGAGWTNPTLILCSQQKQNSIKMCSIILSNWRPVWFEIYITGLDLLSSELFGTFIEYMWYYYQSLNQAWDFELDHTKADRSLSKPNPTSHKNNMFNPSLTQPWRRILCEPNHHQPQLE